MYINNRMELTIDNKGFGKDQKEARLLESMYKNDTKR